MKKENKIIADKIFSLDSSAPEMSWDEENLWEHIERKISWQRKMVRIMYAAACAGLLIFLSLTLYYSGNHDFTIKHTVEVRDQKSQQANDLHDLEASTLEFIRASCEADIDVCQSKEFKALAAELNILYLEITSLENMIATYGEDPAFIKSKIQIENHKSQIIGKLVQMILS